MGKYRFHAAQQTTRRGPVVRVKYANSRLYSTESLSPSILIRVLGLISLVVDRQGVILGVDGYESSDYWTESKIVMPKISDKAIIGTHLPSQIFSNYDAVNAQSNHKNLTSTYDSSTKTLLIGKPCQQVHQVGENVFVHLKKGLISSMYFTGLDLKRPPEDSRPATNNS